MFCKPKIKTLQKFLCLHYSFKLSHQAFSISFTVKSSLKLIKMFSWSVSVSILRNSFNKRSVEKSSVEKRNERGKFISTAWKVLYSWRTFQTFSILWKINWINASKSALLLENFCWHSSRVVYNFCDLWHKCRCLYVSFSQYESHL